MAAPSWRRGLGLLFDETPGLEDKRRLAPEMDQAGICKKIPIPALRGERLQELDSSKFSYRHCSSQSDHTEAAGPFSSITFMVHRHRWRSEGDQMTRLFNKCDEGSSVGQTSATC